MIKKFKEFLADIFFKVAVFIDPRLPDGEKLQKVNAIKFGTAIGRIISPRDFFEDAYFLEEKVFEISPLVNNIRALSKVYEWNEVMYDPVNKTLSFKKEGNRINVYYSKMTICTALNHPKLGKTQLCRKKVTLKELEYIFADPRVHTGKGYHRK